jgi:hypothetical protein
MSDELLKAQIAALEAFCKANPYPAQLKRLEELKAQHVTATPPAAPPEPTPPQPATPTP